MVFHKGMVCHEGYHIRFYWIQTNKFSINTGIYIYFSVKYNIHVHINMNGSPLFYGKNDLNSAIGQHIAEGTAKMVVLW